MVLKIVISKLYLKVKINFTVLLESKVKDNKDINIF